MVVGVRRRVCVRGRRGHYCWREHEGVEVLGAGGDVLDALADGLLRQEVLVVVPHAAT